MSSVEEFDVTRMAPKLVVWLKTGAENVDECPGLAGIEAERFTRGRSSRPGHGRGTSA